MQIIRYDFKEIDDDLFCYFSHKDRAEENQIFDLNLIDGLTQRNPSEIAVSKKDGMVMNWFLRSDHLRNLLGDYILRPNGNGSTLISKIRKSKIDDLKRTPLKNYQMQILKSGKETSEYIVYPIDNSDIIDRKYVIYRNHRKTDIDPDDPEIQERINLEMKFNDIPKPFVSIDEDGDVAIYWLTRKYHDLFPFQYRIKMESLGEHSLIFNCTDSELTHALLADSIPKEFSDYETFGDEEIRKANLEDYL